MSLTPLSFDPSLPLAQFMATLNWEDRALPPSSLVAGFQTAASSSTEHTAQPLPSGALLDWSVEQFFAAFSWTGDAWGQALAEESVAPPEPVLTWTDFAALF